MELWIRSQDKLELTKINSIGIEYDKKLVGYGNVCVKLGEYKSKQRALEILDEIQKKINLINLGHDFGGPMIDLNNPTYIYEMPED